MKFYLKIKIVFEEAQSDVNFGKYSYKLMSSFREKAHRVQCSQNGSDRHHLGIQMEKLSPDKTSMRLWSQMARQEILDLLCDARAQIESIGIGQDAEE